MAILKLLLLPLKLLGQLTRKLLKVISLYFSKLTWKAYLSFFVAIIGLFGTSWGFYTYYSPDVDLVFSDPLKADNIFSSRFTIYNNGNSNIYNIRVGYIVENVHMTIGNNIFRTGTIKSKNDILYNFINSNSKQVIDIRLVDENFFGLNRNQYALTSYNAEIKWFVQYDYWFNYRTKKETICFYTSKLTHDKINWYNTQCSSSVK